MNKDTESLFWPIALPIWAALLLFYCLVIENTIGIGFFTLLLIVGIVYFIYRFRLRIQKRKGGKRKAEVYDDSVSAFDGTDLLPNIDFDIDIDAD